MFTSLGEYLNIVRIIDGVIRWEKAFCKLLKQSFCWTPWQQKTVMIAKAHWALRYEASYANPQDALRVRRTCLTNEVGAQWGSNDWSYVAFGKTRIPDPDRDSRAV